MRIRTLALRNFRKFTQPVVLRGFGPGVNVLAERNEFGKSTILAAINGVVFQRYKAQTEEVRSYQHVRHQAVPEVRLEFELGTEGAAETWSLEKRFAGASGKALLVGPGGQRFENDAAEKRLHELLGLSMGARTVEQGIWGTLWVQQGGSVSLPELSERSVRTIQDCLAAEVGVVAGGRRGRKIPSEVQRALDELVTQAGKPRGRFRAAEERLEALGGELVELERRRQELDEWLARLYDDQRKLERLRASGDEQRYEEQLRALAAERTRAALRAAEIDGARKELALAEGQLDEVRREQAEQARQLEAIGRRAIEVDRLTRERVAVDERVGLAAAALLQARHLVDQRRAEQQAADESERRWRRVQGALELQARSERSRRALEQAAAREREIEVGAREVATIAVTDKLLRAIEKASEQLAAAEAALKAVATFVDLELLPESAGKVTVDGAAPASPTLRLLGDTTIEIAGIGVVRVRPQIADRDSLLAAHARAESELRRRLDEARCTDAAEARQQQARRKDLERQLEFARGKLQGEAPGDPSIGLLPGVAALRESLVADEARLGAELAALELRELPSRAEVEQGSEAALRRSRELKDHDRVAERELEGAGQRAESARLELARVEEQLRAVVAEQEQGRFALAAARQRRTDEALAGELAARAAEVERCRAALDLRLASHSESVADLDVRAERIEKAREQHARTEKQLGDAILQNRTRVEANEGDGIDEKLDARRAEEARLREQLAALREEVEVLQLLSQVLRESERAASERYLAPVVARVEPYLRTLLPQARLSMSDDFRVQGIERGAHSEELMRLSDGTREQIAVLTRLAFAEMLLAQGRPAMVILDDALVFSDDDRMERMFDILQRAGRRLQVLVLTCRERVFERLGGTQLRLEEEQASLG